MRNLWFNESNVFSKSTVRRQPLTRTKDVKELSSLIFLLEPIEDFLLFPKEKHWLDCQKILQSVTKDEKFVFDVAIKGQ